MPQPCQLVIFGGTGDLSWRKLLPAVYNLAVDGVLPAHFATVAFGIPVEGPTSANPDEWMRTRAKDGIEKFSRQALDEGHWAEFSKSLFFVQGSFDDPEAYKTLKAKLETIDQQFGIPASRVFYLAVPPQLVRMCVEHLKAAGMVRDPGETVSFTRVIVEKPIGRDLESAREVIKNVASAFAESQTYRIDHYLGKETVQNLLVLRFANSIFEPLWNGKFIDHVQITVAEEEGLAQYDPETGEMLSTRAGYYEGVGALRDMVQNHMLQVLCVVAMEPPWSLGPEVVRDAKVGVLNCLRPLTPADVDRFVVRGQYIEGDCVRQTRARLSDRGAPLLRDDEEGAAEGIGQLDDRDVRGDEAVHRQLALGRRAVLSADRQTAAEARQRGGDPVQGRAAGAVQHPRRPAAGADRPLDPRAAAGGPVDADRVEAAGPEDPHLSGEDGVQLQLRVRHPGPRGVRTAAARRDGRRRHALHAPRPGGGGLAVRDADARPLAADACTRSSRVPVRHLGPVEADRIIEPDGRAWRLL